MNIAIFLLISIPVSVYARVEEDITPSTLQECYSAQDTNIQNKLDVENKCLENYLIHVFGNNSPPVISKTAMEWMERLGHKIYDRQKRGTRRWRWRWWRSNRRLCKNLENLETYGYKKEWGFKRNQYLKYDWRYQTRRERKEIRTLTDQERKEFLDAVNALKNDSFTDPDSPNFQNNKYDALALLHQGTAISSGHGGPGFLPWHRYYLYLFEEALREKNPNVTLPYWDSRLDFKMKSPEDSILWTGIFMGNGAGVVYTGPFKNWTTPAQGTLLRRGIPGDRSSLINPSLIEHVLNKKYHYQILTPTAERMEDNLERHHDGVHRYVGGDDGHMGGILTSPQDPVFFLHHCFIDYLWEQFRERQNVKCLDYPITTDEFHLPNRTMDNLKPNRSMLNGFEDHFTNYIYKYAPAPTCENNCGGAYEGFLHCINGECVSRSRQEFRAIGGFSHVQSEYIGIRASDGRPTFRQATPNFRAKIDLQVTKANDAPTISDHFGAGIIDDRIEKKTPGRKRRSLRSPEMHGKYDIKSRIANIAAMPVTIINEHKVKLNFQENYQNSKLFNLEVETFGFTYNARHKGHIVIDNQTHFSESSTLIAFEAPSLTETSAYVRVRDSFGGICQPQCLSKETYKDCTGVIKVTNKLPLMYYNVDNIGDLQSDESRRSFLRFYCRN